MATPTSAYWATSATVDPVLALALVLEARTVAAGWMTGVLPPFSYRVFLSVTWGVPLVAFAILEPSLLGALRGNPSGAWAVWANEVSVALALSTLVLGPAADLLVRANAELFAALLSRHPVIRLRTRRGQKQLLRLHAQITQLQHDMAKDDLESVIARLDAIEPVDLPAERHRELESLREQAATLKAKRDEQLGQVLAQEARLIELQERLSGFRVKTSQLIADERSQIRDTLLRGLAGGPDTPDTPDTQSEDPS